ncbi:MAG: class II aldolase/adducin family protein [candidate division Zixibacteria bacterium]|nr:class II aldolase/adducin family protein [candidate division Zixibacteria bacterium]
MSTILKAKKEIIEIGKRMYNKGYVVASEGNMSIRLGENKILITPSGKNKGLLKGKDLVVVDLKGKKLSGSQDPNSENLKPSSELLMHLFVYQKRKDVNAVVHAHPPYSLAFASAHLHLAQNLLPEVIMFLGEIPLTAYATPSTEEVPISLYPIIERHNAFLLENHGVLTLGKDIDEAYSRLEMVEHLAKVNLLCKILGKTEELSKESLDKLEKLKRI